MSEDAERTERAAQEAQEASAHAAEDADTAKRAAEDAQASAEEARAAAEEAQDQADALRVARGRLLARVSRGDFPTAIDTLFGPIATLAGRITGRRGPLPVWLAIFLGGMIAYGLAWATAQALGEPWFSGELRPFLVTLLLTGTFALVCAHTLSELLRARLEETVIPGVCRLRDLDHIEQGMGQIFSPRRHLTLGVLVSPILYFIFVHGVSGVTEAGLAGAGASGLALFVAFEVALCAYFMMPILAFLPTLGRLHFKLFPLNPRDSEVIVVLQDTTHQVLWIFTALFVPMTFVGQRLNFLHNDAMKLSIAMIAWIPLLVVYLGAQWTFRAMIVRAKFRYINHLQEAITTELYRESPPSDATLARLQTLRAHHDSVVGSPNSAIHLKGILSLANTLLLPLVAALLGNIERIIALFAGAP